MVFKGIHWILLLIFLTAGQPGFSVEPNSPQLPFSASDLEFLRSLGQRYRLGIEIEVTRRHLNTIAPYYSSKGETLPLDVSKLIESPRNAEVRQESPPHIRAILGQFKTIPERGLPDIEFVLKDEVSDELKRNPLAIIQLHSDFSKLVNIDGILGNPFGPYKGISTHIHYSRVDHEGKPQPFEMDRVMAQFDYKAAYIYLHGMEDRFASRPLSIFVQPSPGLTEAVNIRKGTQPRDSLYFSPNHPLNHNLITNWRGHSVESRSRQLKHDYNIDPESFSPTNWIEDKGQIFPPAQQMLWTLKVLEGQIPLSSIYDDVAKMIQKNDFLEHILGMLFDSRARHGLGIGLLHRTARHSSFVGELSRMVGEALVTTVQRFPHYESDIIQNFLLSFHGESDKKFIRAVMDQALKINPKFIQRSHAIFTYDSVDNRELDISRILGEKRINAILAVMNESERNKFISLRAEYFHADACIQFYQ